MTAITRWDEWLILQINRPAGPSELLDQFALDVAESAFLKGGVFLAAYCWIWFEKGPRREELRRMIVASMVAALFVALAARLMQMGVPFHFRPLHAPPFGFNTPHGVHSETLNAWSSFPSDHAAVFFALSEEVSLAAAFLPVAWPIRKTTPPTSAASKSDTQISKFSKTADRIAKVMMKLNSDDRGLFLLLRLAMCFPP